MFRLESNDGAVVLADGTKRLRIGFVTHAIARITFTDGKPFKTTPSFIVLPQPCGENGNKPAYTLQETATEFVLSTVALRLTVNKQTGAICYFDAHGNLLTREPERGGKWLTPKEVYRYEHGGAAPNLPGPSASGPHTVTQEARRVFDRVAFEAKLEFVFSEHEALFGLGSHEEGYGNLRGKSRELYQHNLKAVVPFLVSTKGYAVLLDCGSLMTFHDDAHGSYIWADVVDELDYYFIRGARLDEITRGYYLLTGTPPMLPKWMFGYIQSKERYVNAREMIEVVREYRRRNVPLDVIVLDWKSWPADSGWGQKSLDPVRFPDPKAFIDELHKLGAKLMISIWPKMTGDCPDRRELLERGFMLGDGSTYDAFNPDARRWYWEQARRGLFVHGIDAWWCDCTEPFEPDWSGAVKPEVHARLVLNTEHFKRYLDPAQINLYSLLHSQGIYEGQRSATTAKRVVNLTRSAYAGQHRYATITWSGDICATWETLRRSIPEGLNFCVTGEPYWTLDIGGFFIRHDPALWFWRGDYDAGCRGLTAPDLVEPDPRDTGCTDLGYHELYTRWVQYAVFLPIFRSHGTDAPREIWRFGEPGNPFYDTIAKFIRLRYRLIPYIYSLAAQVTLNGYTLMRPVALDYPDDIATHQLTDQYMFGPAFMVCPVTQPMYFRHNSEPIHDAPKTRKVYLPTGSRWYEFWTEKLFDGGQTIAAEAPLEIIPLFVRAGSIVPMSQVMQYVDEIPDAPYEIRIYTGADAQFTLYEDAGDGYDYEHGAYALVQLAWDEKRGELTISERKGGFEGMVESREYQLVFITSRGRVTKTVRYTGQEAKVSPTTD
ncbi:MAG: glycoside hydrolase family 31 protein [Verrucomicrobiales bacterium]|nr:glycoside hydrolase family 31 protein [Verrucomicrobiales bacterium]